MSAKYVVGIDLGTTNSCLAYAPLNIDDEIVPVDLFAIPQLINRGEIGEELLLPSSLYLPQETEFAPDSNPLPWNPSPTMITGVYAQKRGVEVPGRLVTSAKSWLCFAGIDRNAALLPANAAEGITKISPVAASRQYLEHLRHAWEHLHPDAPLAQQQVLITVPASFDAVARDLTLEAARTAGYGEVVLLEEPQAAFYAWLERHPDWRNRVHSGDLILVVDIGGGTTDFTLITVTDKDGNLELERVAVGEHILLGGDNIDLALAKSVEQDLAARNIKLDAMQLHVLWQRCRAAKEKLLAEGATATEEAVTILGRGTGLIGGTIKATLKRETIDHLLSDGFLPETSSDDLPLKSKRSGLQEVGLPYASDAAIPKHLAKFLRQPSAVNIRRTHSGLAAPTHVLFNGGVLRAPLVRGRLMQILNGWLTAENMPECAVLEGEDLMHAVARGAAYYGQARQGRGIRIRGGVPRTYYIGIESAMPAVPGFRPPVKALVVAPFGMEEGTSVPVAASEFGLVVGEPAEFRFFASSIRKKDAPGEMIELVGDELEELSPIEVWMEHADKQVQAGVVRVTLESVVTETGVLELWCVSRDGQRWKLEFNVRERVQ